MKILVTGGCGFIGSHLCERLIENGEEVAIIDNMCNFYSPVMKEKNLIEIKKKGKVKFYKEDITNISSINHIFATDKYDLVIHIAAMAGVRPSMKNPFLYNEVNIKGTHIILECMKNHNIKKFIFASSSSVYGNTSPPFSEENKTDFPISVYGATKKAAEVLCYTYHSLYGIDMAIMRFFTVYGPRQRPDLAIRKFFSFIIRNKPLPFYGDGSTARDYTFITDIIEGIVQGIEWLMANTNVYEIFNLGNNSPVSLKDLVENIEKITGKKAIIDKKPLPPGDVKITWANIEKSKKLLGYNPKISLQEGLKIFKRWYEEYGE